MVRVSDIWRANLESMAPKPTNRHANMDSYSEENVGELDFFCCRKLFMPVSLSMFVFVIVFFCFSLHSSIFFVSLRVWGRMIECREGCEEYFWYGSIRHSGIAGTHNSWNHQLELILLCLTHGYISSNCLSIFMFILLSLSFTGRIFEVCWHNVDLGDVKGGELISSLT